MPYHFHMSAITPCNILYLSSSCSQLSNSSIFEHLMRLKLAGDSTFLAKASAVLLSSAALTLLYSSQVVTRTPAMSFPARSHNFHSMVSTSEYFPSAIFALIAGNEAMNLKISSRLYNFPSSCVKPKMPCAASAARAAGAPIASFHASTSSLAFFAVSHPLRHTFTAKSSVIVE